MLVTIKLLFYAHATGARTGAAQGRVRACQEYSYEPARSPVTGVGTGTGVERMEYEHTYGR